MGKKFYESEKFQAVFFPILYFVLAIALVVTGSLIFKKVYYHPVVVDGSSMLPTLAGGSELESGGSITVDGHNVSLKYRYNYGIADLTKASVNNIKRFDVIVTHYPKSWGTEEEDYIIKRVWGFPGETLNLTYDGLAKTFTFTASKKGKETYKIIAPIVEYTKKFEAEYMLDGKYHTKEVESSFPAAKFKLSNKTFYTNTRVIRQLTNHKLEKNEYFVMGDNWETSTDSWKCRSLQDKLTKSYLQGRVLYISAYVSIVNEKPTNFHNIKKRYNF